jgi:hypothetical protein
LARYEPEFRGLHGAGAGVGDHQRTAGPSARLQGIGSARACAEDHGVNPPSAYPPRTRFRLPAKSSQFESCCDQPAGPGYEFLFSDHGRDFYAFVYASQRSAADEAIAILNTLRVT